MLNKRGMQKNGIMHENMEKKQLTSGHFELQVQPLPPGRRRPPQCKAGGCQDCSSCRGGRLRAATSSRSVLQMDAEREAKRSKV